MEIEHRRPIPGPPERAFELIDDLARYPQWMDLVHDVAPSESTDGRAAWNVELQAQVGPFARSKRLRMVRTVHDPAHEVVFERSETDGRHHSAWVLRARLDPGEPGELELVMQLVYGGNLWAGAVLSRVLDDHVERGAVKLRSLLDATT